IEPDVGSRWRRIAPHKGDSGFSGFIPGPETTRVLALIDRGATALLCLGGDRSEHRHRAPQVDKTAARTRLARRTTPRCCRLLGRRRNHGLALPTLRVVEDTNSTSLI